MALSTWDSIMFLISSAAGLSQDEPFAEFVSAISFPASFFAHALHKARDVHHRASYRPAPNLLNTIMSANAHDIKAAIERFQLRLGLNTHPNPACRPMLHIDQDPHRD